MAGVVSVLTIAADLPEVNDKIAEIGKQKPEPAGSIRYMVLVYKF